MKKIFLLAASVLLLMAGCSKEEGISANGTGDIVTFTVTAEGATKAVADGDGHAAGVNHWIMEVRDCDGKVYNRQEDDATAGTLAHSFSVKLVKGQTYQALFWADTKGTYNVSNLTDVKLIDAESAGYAANKDTRDAFSAADASFTFEGTSQRNVTLKRPFGQLNIIFTDLDDLYSTCVDSAQFLTYRPCSLNVSAKLPTTFNVKTQTAGDPVTTALNITASKDYLDNYCSHGSEETIFMDYFFATAGSSDVVDVDFDFTSRGAVIAHSFTNVPFQRNYRTNIKGDLMVTEGEWNVTVDPVWEGEHNQIVKVEDIKSANAAIQANSTAKTIDVKFSAEPNDSGVPTGTESSASRAILTTPVAQGATLSIEVASQTNALYIGDYEYDYDVTTMATSTTPQAATVNINVPSTGSIGTLVINAPSKTVYINGKQVASVGVITNLDAITSDNTLVIEENQTVTNLTIRQGALEIHGAVEAATVEVAQGKNVYVRDCEGLSQSVYDVLKSYIDVDNGYAGKVNSQDPAKWDICRGDPVAKIGDVEYYTLKKAFEDAQTGQGGQTIELLKSCSLTETITVDKSVTLDLGTDTLTNACSGYAFDLSTTTEGKVFKITGTDADNCGHVISNGTGGHSGVACINESSAAVTFGMDYVKVHGATEQDAYNAGSIIISDNSTERKDQINLTEVSINGNQDLVSGSAGCAYASINVKGGIYSTTGRGFRFCGAAGSGSVIDSVNLTTGSGIAVYAFSTTTLKDSEVNMTSGNDAVSCSRNLNDDAVLTITNTKVTTQGNSAVAVESLGVVNINSGEFSNDNNDKNVIKVSTSSGTININGGTVKAKSSTQVTLFTNTNSQSAPDPDAAIYVNGGEIYGIAGVSSDHAFIVINGGTFKNDFTLYEGGTQYIRIAAESSAVFEGKVNGTTSVAIPAGTFKKAIVNGDFTGGASISGGLFYEAAPYSDYIAQGYTTVDNGDDTWSVVPGGSPL